MAGRTVNEPWNLQVVGVSLSTDETGHFFVMFFFEGANTCFRRACVVFFLCVFLPAAGDVCAFLGPFPAS